MNHIIQGYGFHRLVSFFIVFIISEKNSTRLLKRLRSVRFLNIIKRLHIIFFGGGKLHLLAQKIQYNINIVNTVTAFYLNIC